MKKLDRDTHELVSNMIRYQPDDQKIATWAGCDIAHVERIRRRWLRDHSGRMHFTARSYKPTTKREGVDCEQLGGDSFTRGAIRGSAKLLKALQRVQAA